jgi:hypothetical protein
VKVFSSKRWVSTALLFCLFWAVPVHADPIVLLSNGCGTANLGGLGFASLSVDARGGFALAMAARPSQGMPQERQARSWGRLMAWLAR